MTRGFTPKSPEQLKADRLERESRERQATLDRRFAERTQWSGGLLVVGGFLLLLGVYFLILDPGVGRDVVNLQKLYASQTSAVVGAVLFASGALLRHLQ
jgi:uncharacterized membrane protein